MIMGRILYITGGARSGKSRFAESLLAGADDVLYMATAIGFDDEMRDRIARHRSRRNPSWETVESYRHLGAQLKDRIPGRANVILDCVTLLVNNMMLVDSGIDWENAGPGCAEKVEGEITTEITDFIIAAHMVSGLVVIVSNEVGLGLVPPTPLGRYFRDIAGKVNQFLASEASEVYFMVSGLPVKIK